MHRNIALRTFASPGKRSWGAACYHRAGRHVQAPPARWAPVDSELITRRLCLIKDTGHAGVLWGGNMMAWVDEAGAIYAGRQVENRFMVTKAFTEIDFQSRVVPGDMVSFYGRVARVGRTSLSVDLRVTATHPAENDEREVLRVTGVFVAMDESGRTEPIRLRAQKG